MREVAKMREVFTMWRHTKMIVLVALSAAIYAALLIPFQAIPIIPGHVSLRIGSILPMVLGFLFGPAGAWGSAIGNLIGDFFGTLSPGAIGGFIGNFMHAYLTYKIWNALSRKLQASGNIDSLKRLLKFEAVALLKISITTPILVGWVSLILGLAPARIFYPAVLFTEFIPCMIIAPIVIRILYPRIDKWGLLWTDIMNESEVSSGKYKKAGLLITAIFGIAGITIMTVLIYTTSDPNSNLMARTAWIPFTVIGIIGASLMGGRELIEERNLADK